MAKKSAYTSQVENMSDDNLRDMLKAVAAQLDKRTKKETVPVPKDWLTQIRTTCKDLMADWELTKEMETKVKVIFMINTYNGKFSPAVDFDDDLYDHYSDKEAAKVPEVAEELERRKVLLAETKKSIVAMAKQVGITTEELWDIIETKNNTFYQLHH